MVLLNIFQVNYWLKLTETQLDARQYIIYKQTDQATIIGLRPDTWYTVTVIAFNNAGNSLKSEVAHQQTDRSGNSLFMHTRTEFL